MANELKISLSATLNNGFLQESFSPGSLSVDQAVRGSHASTVSVGTSEEDLPVGDVATLGYLFLRNIDTTNYVTYGPKSGGSMVAFGRIRAGEVAMIRLEPGITLRWIANTAAVKVKALLLEA